ncbi:MAG: hypothetical protein AB7U95_37295, partial [Reyranella sp.]
MRSRLHGGRYCIATTLLSPRKIAADTAEMLPDRAFITVPAAHNRELDQGFARTRTGKLKHQIREFQKRIRDRPARIKELDTSGGRRSTP